MALTPKKVYALLKKYTDDSIAGGGISAGKNCTIKSITAITGGNRVEFEWILDNGTVKTETMDVMDGAKGSDGAPGADGLTPTITISEITGGHKVTVTIGSTTDDFDVMDGSQGPAGQGVPTGGTAGQVLKKKSGTNYDTEWADEEGGGTGHGIPAGGTQGQMLVKSSNSDYEVEWTDQQDLSNYVQKSDTVGLLKNDGEVDTNHYQIDIEFSGKGVII